MTADEQYHHAPWMTDDQWHCAQMWSRVMHGFHHCGDFKPFGRGICVSEPGGYFATTDFDYLSRVVFLAHDWCVRVELAASSPGRVKFALHRRHKREGSMSARHPALEQAVAEFRTRNPEPTVEEA
jgi:hypothetical protein